MTRMISLAASALLALCVTCAHAQRRNIPVADLIDVPVSLATPKSKTSDQVRTAIIAAALASECDLEPVGEGAFRVSLVREFDSRVVMNIRYSATEYSLTYEGSGNLSYLAQGDLRNHVGPITPADNTREWRSSRAAKQPEFKYAVDRISTIHPAYEQYLYEFSASVRRQLRWMP